MMILTFFVSLGVGLLCVPLVKRLAIKLGKVSQPRADRWHSKPTPYMGGIAIFVSFIASVLITTSWETLPWLLLAGATVAFALGVIDDLARISPQVKLLGLFIAASFLIYAGYITAFTPWAIVNITISFIWIVGIANAMNLIDNMDGLSSGTSLVIAVFLAYFFWDTGDFQLLHMTVAIAGAVLSFFIFNFPPASIFMGDSGSLFLGLTLAGMAIAREPQASNVLAVMGIPGLIFALPILDTAMVSLTRLLRGQSPAQGGRDHTSHRLVSLGLSERQTLFILLSVAILSGLSAIFLEYLSYSLSLILIPSLMLVLTLLTAYLGQLKVVETQAKSKNKTNLLTNWVIDLTYRRRVFEVLFDFTLIIISYFLVFLIRHGISLNPENMNNFLNSLPFLIGATFFSFFLLGIYRGVWRYLSINDAYRYIVAVILGAFFSGVLIWLVFSVDEYASATFVIYAVVLTLMLLGSRFSFRLLDRVSTQLQHMEHVPILIYGAGDAGQIVLREIQQNTTLEYRPIGFIDDDPLKKDRVINGLPVMGSIEGLDVLIDKYEIKGVIIASNSIVSSEGMEKVMRISKQKKIWIRQLRFDFELV